MLLSAGIGLIGIQDFDSAGGFSQSAAQIAAYVSCSLSLSVPLVVQLLRCQDRTYQIGTTEISVRASPHRINDGIIAG